MSTLVITWVPTGITSFEYEINNTVVGNILFIEKLNERRNLIYNVIILYTKLHYVGISYKILVSYKYLDTLVS